MIPFLHPKVPMQRLFPLPRGWRVGRPADILALVLLVNVISKQKRKLHMISMGLSRIPWSLPFIL